MRLKFTGSKVATSYAYMLLTGLPKRGRIMHISIKATNGGTLRTFWRLSYDSNRDNVFFTDKTDETGLNTENPYPGSLVSGTDKTFTFFMPQGGIPYESNDGSIYLWIKNTSANFTVNTVYLTVYTDEKEQVKAEVVGTFS